MTKLSLGNVTPVTGLIPAAGRGSRLPGLPCSKEMLPIPAADGVGTDRAIENSMKFLLDCGIERQHVVLAPSKKDIRAFLENSENPRTAIGFTEIADSPDVPHSLAAALGAIESTDVVLVFPDIMFEPRAAIAALFADFPATDLDVLLPLVPSTRGDKVDMVAADDDGSVTGISPKPGPGIHGWTWVAAAWSRDFTAFLLRFLANNADLNQEPPRSGSSELYIGDVINAAIAEGLRVGSARFPEGDTIDIGTPDDFASAWRRTGKPIPAAVEVILRGI